MPDKLKWTPMLQAPTSDDADVNGEVIVLTSDPENPNKYTSNIYSYLRAPLHGDWWTPLPKDIP